MKQHLPVHSVSAKEKNLFLMIPSGFIKKRFIFSIFPLLLLFFSFNAKAQIIDDGASHTVSYNGTYQDFVIPNNLAISKITFTLNGGDGGTAHVHDSYPDLNPFGCYCDIQVNLTANGGAGATSSLTVNVGIGAGKIPHGSTIRLIVGGKGTNGSSNGAVGVGFDYGGGGGGTGVLYKAPGDPGFTLLGVAGGGGGAYQGMFAWSSVDHENGQGGLSSTNGGSGNGDLDVGSGGCCGNGGDANELGGAGGGAYTSGGGVSCVSLDLDFNTSYAGEGGPGFSGGTSIGGYGGDSDGCLSFTWRNGGYGFGGGGAASGAGGGGGGYSGGGTGGTTGRGGGGGSYISSFATYNSINGGGSTGSPAHGYAGYQVTLNPPPVAICTSIDVNLLANGTATIIPAMINNGSYDPQGETLTYSLSKTSFNCSNVGANQVTLTVTDPAGQTDDCTATVTIHDVTPPNVVTKNISVDLDATGNATITTAMINNGSTDACGIASYSLNITAFDCGDVGNNTVSLTVTDVNGNAASASATVTVNDVTAPNVVTKNISVDLDATGNISITPSMINDGSTDACGIASYALDITAFDCGDVGDNTVMLTVTDVNSNSASALATVTINDVTPPVVVTQNITVELDANGDATITTAMIDDGSSDACGIASYALDITAFDCDDVGDNTVVLTVTDVNSNAASAPATVKVEDNIPPTIVSLTPSPAILWSPNHKMEDIVVTINSFDNCSGHTCEIISVSSDEPLNDIGDGNTEVDYIITGSNTIQLRAERNGKGIGRIYTITVECTDASGNTTQATTIVSVAHDQSITSLRSQPIDIPAGTFNLEVVNNPSASGQPFALRILSSDKQSPIQLRIVDATGRPVETKKGMASEQVISFGQQYRAGVYFAEAMQNGQRKTVKLLKF